MTRREQVLTLWRQGHTKTAIARRLGMRRGTVIDWIQAAAGKGDGASLPPVGNVPPIVAEVMAEREPKGETTEGPREYTHKEDGDTARVEFTSPKRIRTLEDAIAFAEVDLGVWRVKRWACSAWETSMKLSRRDDRGRVREETPHTTQQWRVWMELERLLPKPLQDATEAIFERMREHAPKYPKPPARTQPKRPHMLEIDIFDAHFGKLSWSPETGPGQSFDLRIAESLYRNAVDDLLDLAAGFEIERFLLPIGNDFYHIDSPKNQTTAGTQVDTDGRYAKIIEVGEMAVIWAVERLVSIAPVDVIWCPGNHDKLASFHLARNVRAWFRTVPDVAVDCSPKVRKYYRYGTTLLGFEHGDKVKHDKLAGLMPLEAPRDFADTTTREFHVGHQHRARKFEFASLDTHGGIPVRVLRSLSAVDSWHFEHAFVGSLRAAEAYLFSRAGGYCGHFVANARLDAS